MLVGLFGGSFDPPHLGHLMLAQCAADELALEKVYLVPAFRSPFKSGASLATVDDRIEMVSSAILDNPLFSLSRFETSRTVASFTVDSIRHFRNQFPGATLVLLMGADSFIDFPGWMDPDEIVSMATLGIACRSGYPLDFSSHPYRRHAREFAMPNIDISSTIVRERVRAGKSIRYFVPHAVHAIIESKGLYR
jgi:nicotinate-nucleotide adenylyltransferase